MRQPLLSIIIANYNYGKFLEDAIRSVCAQRCDAEVELIICDGGSTDCSVEVIKKYESFIYWWCSEKDSGQSSAFNKGFAHAHGRFLTWLNADDILMPGTIKALLDISGRFPDCQWFTGNYLEFRDDNNKIIKAPWGPHYLPAFVHSFSAPLIIFGPTTFWSADAYMKVGPIDESLHYSMDTDYWLRMKKAGYRQKRINHCCWAFRMHGNSKTAQYEGRVIPDKIKEKWYEELYLVNNRIGYHCSRVVRWMCILTRLIDGSVLVALLRRIFLVGKKIDWKFLNQSEMQSGKI